MTRRVQRPRLERRIDSAVSAKIEEDRVYVYDAGYMSKADCKRLHAFLAKAIHYLEQRKAGK